jgi:hypothetical protein
MAQTDYKASDLPGVNLYTVDTAQQHKLNTIATGFSPTYGSAEFIYLKGVASTAEGSAVTYDELGVTALLAANAKGPVAFALAACVANTFGWYQILGKAAVKVAASSADEAFLGRESADGTVGDGRAAGDQIYNLIARSATDTPATGFCWAHIWGHPFVDDTYGA